MRSGHHRLTRPLRWRDRIRVIAEPRRGIAKIPVQFLRLHPRTHGREDLIVVPQQPVDPFDFLERIERRDYFGPRPPLAYVAPPAARDLPDFGADVIDVVVGDEGGVVRGFFRLPGEPPVSPSSFFRRSSTSASAAVVLRSATS